MTAYEDEVVVAAGELGGLVVMVDDVAAGGRPRERRHRSGPPSPIAAPRMGSGLPAGRLVGGGIGREKLHRWLEWPTERGESGGRSYLPF